MFRGSEPSDALSFTDETSRQKEKKTQSRVWTHAQVSRLSDIQWFHHLREFYPDIVGELKSSQIIDDFYKFPLTLIQRISPGLRTVRVHVVDTFVYEAEARQLMRTVMKYDDYEKVLRTHEDQEFAKHLVKGMEEYVATQILLDSPAQRLERALQARRLSRFGYFGAITSQQESRRKLAVDLDPFKKGRKNLGDTAAKWVSKSGAVMSDALVFANHQFLGEYEARQFIADMLNVAHAFDEGDDTSVKWVKGQRDHFVIDTVYGLHGFLKPLYGNVDSRLSPRTQAADIAARIAQRVYDENGLKGLLDQFTYVTFNGEKVTESNIKSILEFWREIEHREERIEKILKGVNSDPPDIRSK